MKTILNDMIPTTARQAFKILDDMCSAEKKATFLSQSKEDFICNQYFGLGAWIRNNWIYGPEKESEEDAKRREACLEMLTATQKGDPIIVDPDGISCDFLSRYYEHLKRVAR